MPSALPSSAVIRLALVFDVPPGHRLAGRCRFHEAARYQPPCDAAARSDNDSAFSVDEPSRVVPPSPTIYGLNMGQGLRKVAPQHEKVTLKIIIVYYYYFETRKSHRRRDADRHGDFRDDATIVTIGFQAYCLAGDR